ncbi:MarR family winged helix-turn-helix transcriptional regulator [Actinacidiphila acididurans]|uniref:Winged helix-turn-helix transcriptional regulator n=1 Tax=Actinacidiphila acididurans TaxID=2784346 RepID=A0ABS2TR11_9ACTN|nr:MarR family winged helix-turn-helix transcriptional regulator [Actinacidiphila acididurans]MBM9505776.1 winged helix-turn-helix transcriptional regulator [Actinacidiphila acididurans]
MPETPPLVAGSAADHTVWLLLKLGQAVFRLCEDGLGGLGLRARHYSVLQALADNGPTVQLALGARLRIDPATMVSSLDHLERAGYVARSRDPLDRRRCVVAVTEDGRKVLGVANGRLEGLGERALAELTAAERRVLHQLLTGLASGAILPAAFDAVRNRPPTERTATPQP